MRHVGPSQRHPKLRTHGPNADLLNSPAILSDHDSTVVNKEWQKETDDFQRQQVAVVAGRACAPWAGVDLLDNGDLWVALSEFGAPFVAVLASSPLHATGLMKRAVDVVRALPASSAENVRIFNLAKDAALARAHNISDAFHQARVVLAVAYRQEKCLPIRWDRRRARADDTHGDDEGDQGDRHAAHDQDDDGAAASKAGHSCEAPTTVASVAQRGPGRPPKKRVPPRGQQKLAPRKS